MVGFVEVEDQPVPGKSSLKLYEFGYTINIGDGPVRIQISLFPFPRIVFNLGDWISFSERKSFPLHRDSFW